MTTETKSLAAKITKGEAVAEQDGYMFVRRGDRKPLPFNGAKRKKKK